MSSESKRNNSVLACTIAGAAYGAAGGAIFSVLWAVYVDLMTGELRYSNLAPALSAEFVCIVLFGILGLIGGLFGGLMAGLISDVTGLFAGGALGGLVSTGLFLGMAPLMVTCANAFAGLVGLWLGSMVLWKPNSRFPMVRSLSKALTASAQDNRLQRIRRILGLAIFAAIVAVIVILDTGALSHPSVAD